MSADSPELEALRRRLEEEEGAYAALLAAVDRLASFPLPREALPQQPAQMEELNRLWELPAPTVGGGLKGRHQQAVWNVVGPILARQQQFNSVLVQVLNGQLNESARLHERLRELVSTLVQYFQRLLPVMDARDRLGTALATTRAELILEAFDRRQESLGRRLEGLLALRDRLEAQSEEVRALKTGLASPPAPAVAGAALQAAADSRYAAFENRFRGQREDIRERLAGYVALFREGGPVADLGCGRGEFLELLREAGIEACGVESNADLVAACRERSLEVSAGDLVAFLAARPAASLGGVFAAQVAEHLPPAVLQALLRESHRALRAGGRLVLETVNPRSVIGFLEVYLRDLTHERALHPDTLSFLAAAEGFTEVRVELRSPVDPAMKLRPLPAAGLPAEFASILNENLERLNGLLYGPQEYVLLARR